MFGWFRPSRRNGDDLPDDGYDRAYDDGPGYYSLDDAPGDGWDFDDYPAQRARIGPRYDRLADDEWDARLDRIDRQADREYEYERRRRLGWWRPSYWRGRGKGWWFVRAVAAMLLAFILLVGWLAITAPLNKSLEPIAPPQITLLASDGTPIARSGAMVQDPVKVADLPDHVVGAFLSIEDRRFYSHWGVDPRGIARAAWTGKGGGSTITQQLAKFTFLTPEQTLTRKAREALIALWLESWLTKDQILERYLSNAYFGDNQYGLRAASLHYFYRQPEKLRPEQAAMLAGLLKAPSRLAPTKNYDLAAARMKLVIGAMEEEGYLTAAKARALRNPPLDVRTRDTLPTGTYFADWALPFARKQAERNYARTTITTTLDARLQGIAGRVIRGAPLGNAQVALVAMRPSGEIVAMVGGRDYARSPFNRATQARRQPGSTFKLFTYLAALDAGMDPGDMIDNREITQGSYRPRNAKGQYSPTITLENAFARSSNVATVRLFNQLGSEAVIDKAREFGIRADMARGDPSVALGTSSTTLLQMTAAYAGVAGNRYPVVPHAFPRAEESWWESFVSGDRSMSRREHAGIEKLLRSAVNRGTGRAAMLSVPNFGKTGTTQDNRDALFIGYAGDLVVGVWIGNDDNSPLKGVSGGGLPARIWRDFMRAALSNRTAPLPEVPPDPGGPVQPMDIPEVPELPGDMGGVDVTIRDGSVVVSGADSGIPVDVILGEDGVSIDPRRLEEMIEREAEARERELERIQQAIDR